MKTEKSGIVIPGLPDTMFVSGRGTIIGMEDRVFFVSNGKQVERAYVKPRDPMTERQLEHRALFGEVVKGWRALSPEKRREYGSRAEFMDMTGFNLYVSEVFKGRKEAGGYQEGIERVLSGY